MNRALFIACTVLILLANASSLWSADCKQCHTAKGVKERAPAVEPIVLKHEGRSRIIELSDAFKVHGHSCPGMTTTFLAFQYAMDKLYGKEIPEQEDLVIVSRTPTPGCLDFLDLVMMGNKGKGKTVAPEGMRASRENYCYTFYRKSTGTAVDIRLKPESYPKDFFKLKKKHTAGKMTPEEWDRLHGYMKDIILNFPKKSAAELFGNPQPYRVIFWGRLLPAHAAPETQNKN